MKLSDEKRAEFWREFGAAKHKINQLKAMFQNRIDLTEEDFMLFNGQLVTVFKQLQGLQVKMAVEWEKGKKGFKGLEPGTQEWGDYWKAHPEKQGEMLEWKRRRGEK